MINYRINWDLFNNKLKMYGGVQNKIYILFNDIIDNKYYYKLLKTSFNTDRPIIDDYEYHFNEGSYTGIFKKNGNLQTIHVNYPGEYNIKFTCNHRFLSSNINLNDNDIFNNEDVSQNDLIVSTNGFRFKKTYINLDYGTYKIDVLFVYYRLLNNNLLQVEKSNTYTKSICLIHPIQITIDGIVTTFKYHDVTIDNINQLNIRDLLKKQYAPFENKYSNFEFSTATIKQLKLDIS